MDVRQVDLAGNVSAASAGFNFTLDSHAAAPTLALKVDSGASQTDRLTNDGTLLVGGVEPGASLQYNDRGDGSFDYNCDGLETERYTTTYSCRAECQGGTVEGWIGPVPACGDQGTWGSSCNQTNNGPNFCEPDSTRTRTQTCQ